MTYYLEREHLFEVLRSLSETAETHSRIAFDYMDRKAFDSGRATAIYRILQELLTNVARHAAATEVQVQLAQKDKDVILIVRDNGRGMPAERLSAKDSLGILGMQERALAFGGELVFSSAPGTGTSVKVRIPL